MRGGRAGTAVVIVAQRDAGRIQRVEVIRAAGVDIARGRGHGGGVIRRGLGGAVHRPAGEGIIGAVHRDGRGHAALRHVKGEGRGVVVYRLTIG